MERKKRMSAGEDLARRGFKRKKLPNVAIFMGKTKSLKSKTEKGKNARKSTRKSEANWSLGAGLCQKCRKNMTENINRICDECKKIIDCKII
jgi:hypothetical protein